MPAGVVQCLSENEVLSVLRGTLTDGARASAQEHIDQCPACQEVFSCLAQTKPDDLASGARARAMHEDLPHGSKVGRYRLVDTVGAGAMGIVYLADDPDLDRRVALKMLRRQDARASERLTREAQALARVSHPNVIVVYEVGAFEDQVYMAMEFVQGESLTSWLAKERSASEILATFTQAGRGLAAAHEAGLIHRDFKPDNVLVGRDGRVRVVDFGLARADAWRSAVSEAESGPTLAKTEKKAYRTLTRTGAFVGTPVYMAPEQYDGLPADARTDQFAFCVSLYEALYERRPFEAETLAELAQAVKTGAAAPPRGLPAPGRVERAVMRGLSVRPDDRFPSMDALLAELAPPAAAKRLGALVALAAGAAVATAAAVAVASFVRAPAAAAGSRSAVETAATLTAPVVAPASAPPLETQRDTLAMAAAAPVTSPAPAASLAARSVARPAARPPSKIGTPKEAAPSGPLMPTTP